MTIIFRLTVAGLLSMALLAGCMSPKGDTAEEKRQSVEQMRSETLAELYEVHPYAQAQINGRTESAYGTACREPDGTWRIVE